MSTAYTLKPSVESFTRALEDYMGASRRYMLERREEPDVRIARANRMVAHAVALAIRGELAEATRLVRAAVAMLSQDEEVGKGG